MALQRAELNASVRTSVADLSGEYTALHLAVLELNASVVEVLLSRDDVDVNEADKYGNTPMQVLINSPGLTGNPAYQPASRRHVQGQPAAGMHKVSQEECC